jgi:hypothetical protein
MNSSDVASEQSPVIKLLDQSIYQRRIWIQTVGLMRGHPVSQEIVHNPPRAEDEQDLPHGITHSTGVSLILEGVVVSGKRNIQLAGVMLSGL